MVISDNSLDYNTPSTLEWNGLSMKDKAAFIRLAVAAGYKNIDDIRQLYKELNDINLFDRGGSKERHRFTPSKAVRDRISKWEGNAMVKDTVDPLSGKLVKRNNSFENEAAAFVNAIPPALRRTVLSNLDLADHLYSYSYNVGAGKFKERVVPKLIDYYNGKATIDDVTNSMWAAGDTKLKGLRLRREVEKEGVRNALQNMINPYTTSSVVELPVDAVRISMPVDTVTPYTVPKVIDAPIFDQPLRQYFKYTPEYLINQVGKIIVPESSINTAVPLTATEILKLLELLKQQLRKTLLDLELEDSLYADGGNLFEDGGDTDYVANYDDTYGAKYGILPEVVVTPNNTPNIIKPKLNEEQWLKYWRDEGAASVSKGMNDAAPYVASVLSYPFLIQDAISAPLGFVGGIAGGTAGGYVGEKVGDFIGKDLLGSTSNIGEEIGQTLGAIPGGTLGYGLLLKPQRSIGRIYNALHPSKIADRSDINPSLTFRERMLYDTMGNFKETMAALKEGKYVHDFKSLRRNAERAAQARDLGFKSTDEDYYELTGFPFHDAKVKTELTREGKNYYVTPTKKINVSLTNDKNSNIVRDNYLFIVTGGHEKTHANNHILNTLFNTPTLDAYNKNISGFIPNMRHPIAKKYNIDFITATTPHGKSPEESWANLMGYRAANGHIDANEFLNLNTKAEGVDVPVEFFTDYAKYLEDTYKPLAAKFFK